MFCLRRSRIAGAPARRAQALGLVALLAFALEARAGSISGVIENPDKCKGVAALQREGADPRKPKLYQGDYDPATGKFKIDNLPQGDYDLRLTLENGQIDGANLKLDPWERAEEPLAEEDRQAILDQIANYPPSFEDIHRPLAINGNGKHAKVLVELIRYTQFHSGRPGDVIWRVEIWQYDKFPGGWTRKQRWFRVLSRVRAPQEMPLDQLHNQVWLFDPKLGGLHVGEEGNVGDIKYKVPDPPSDETGKTPGSITRQAAEHEKKITEKEAEP